MGIGNRKGPPEIIREAGFDESLARIAESYERLHELDQAIDWALVKDPKRFFGLRDGYHLWKIGKVSPAFPALRIVYRYDEEAHEVLLIAVEEVEEEPSA